MPIQIIQATPGPTTTERILDLIVVNPQGITIRELSHQLNRPVSMVYHCVKILMSSGEVDVRLTDNGMQQICYPKIITLLVSQSELLNHRDTENTEFLVYP